MKSLVVIFTVLFSLVVFAQAAPSASPSASVAPKIIQVLQNVDAHIPATIPTWVLAVLAFLGEMLVRLLPSAKPRSILLLVAAVSRGIGTIFEKVSGLLDLVAQNLKADPAAVVEAVKQDEPKA